MLENTGQWLLKKKQFREWRSTNVSSVLWLHGIRKLACGFALKLIHVLTYDAAGAGKTKLT